MKHITLLLLFFFSHCYLCTDKLIGTKSRMSTILDLTSNSQGFYTENDPTTGDIILNPAIGLLLYWKWHEKNAQRHADNFLVTV
jgi:hypothetical protein